MARAVTKITDAPTQAPRTMMRQKNMTMVLV